MTSFRSLKRFVCDWQGIALSMMWIFLLEWTVFVSRRENFRESSKRQSQAEWTYNPKLSAQLCWTLKWWRPKAQFYDPECFKNYNTLLESLKKKTILYFTNLKSGCNSLPESPDFQGTCSALAAKNWRLVAISLSSSFNRCSSSFFCRFFNFSFSATFASKNDARTAVKRWLESSDSIYEHLHCHCHVLWCNINSWKWCSNWRDSDPPASVRQFSLCFCFCCSSKIFCFFCSSCLWGKGWWAQSKQFLNRVATWQP